MKIKYILFFLILSSIVYSYGKRIAIMNNNIISDEVKGGLG
jgi:hypothetical protein